MNNLTIIGFVGGDAEVRDLKKDGNTVTTFSVATKEVRGSGDDRKEYTTWHNVSVFGGLQRFASTILKGDQIAVQGPIVTSSYEGRDGGKVQTYYVRANILEMLKRKTASTNAPVEAPVEDTESVPF